MIDRIKLAIAEYYGEREWFMICLRTGGWVQHDSWLYDTQYRIEVDEIKIDITDHHNGKYRVSVGAPGAIMGLPNWKNVQFAETSVLDDKWEADIQELLRQAYNPRWKRGRI